MKKLTLSAEPDVIAEAHCPAGLQGTSVSAMFSRVVRLLSHRDRERPRLGPVAKKASGLIQLPEGKSGCSRNGGPSMDWCRYLP
jgi:hypothetical protein